MKRELKGRVLIASVLSVVVLLAALATPAEAATRIRPIEEFVQAQGTFCVPDGGGGCVLYVPPVQNFMGWIDPATGQGLSVDYAGLAERWIKAASGGARTLGTTYEGTIVERPLADGRALVHVQLHTSNALIWGVTDGGDFTSALVFGYRAPEVLYEGKPPALGDAQMQLEFVNAYPGAPLPDLLEMDFANVRQLAISASATGELRAPFGVPEGTPGTVHMRQTGLIKVLLMRDRPHFDGFPAEHITFRPSGGDR